MFIIRKIWSVLTLPLLFLTILTSPVAQSTETAELVSQNVYALENALFTGQGIATDGEYYYTSGSITALNFTALAKIAVEDMEIKDVRINPLPDKCTDRGNNHIGGISVYNGKIYASVEGGDEVTACIVTFDPETLEAIDVYDLPNEKFPDGVPWCAVDGNTGYLYASMWDQTKTIYVYDVNNEMAFVKELPLTGIGSIKRIQGGEFLDGTLYLSKDNNDKGKIRDILSVDVTTGEVKLVAERNVGSENYEAEGMTFTKGDNAAELHVLDYNRTIGIFVHHYTADFA